MYYLFHSAFVIIFCFVCVIYSTVDVKVCGKKEAIKSINQCIEILNQASLKLNEENEEYVSNLNLIKQEQRGLRIFRTQIEN